MLKARLTATVVFPQSSVGEVTAKVRHPFALIALSTLVRSTSNAGVRMSILFQETMRFAARVR